MYNTQTRTNTFTVTDIKKTFEGCEADIRAIARRTGKWTTEYVDKVIYDILALAESGYLSTVSITLVNSTTNIPVRAAKFVVNSEGNTVSSERPGKNLNWPNLSETKLTVILSYTNKWHNLSFSEQSAFQYDNDFKISWSSSNIDTNFSNLSSSQSQLYGSNGYELQKMDYR